VDLVGTRACKLEHVIVVLLLDFRAPIPRRRQATIDAGARVEEVVRAGAVECVSEEVNQDGPPAPSASNACLARSQKERAH
jgi:hypothetical protein